MDKKLIGEKIGEGAMAIVSDYNTNLVIKTAKKGREANLLDEIKFMNAARELEVAPTIIESGSDFYIMKKYKSDLLEFIKANKESLEFGSLLKISTDIAKKIERLHLSGILHRDIKPQNILIDSINDVVLADFGIAFAGSETRKTKRGIIKGSIMDDRNIFLGRETVINNNSYHTDLYAFGMTMLFIFNKKNDEQTNTIINKCMAPNLEDRYKNFEEVINALENYGQ